MHNNLFIPVTDRKTNEKAHFIIFLKYFFIIQIFVDQVAEIWGDTVSMSLSFGVNCPFK